MITDGRYCLRAQNLKTLWRFDSKKRKHGLIDVGHYNAVFANEGTGALLLVSQETEGGVPTRVVATVHMPEQPEEPVARGEFQDGVWKFAGIPQAWALVPDYVVLPPNRESEGGDKDAVAHLLRIADDTKLTGLAELGEMFDAVNVPDSRLLVMTGGGALGVLDPISGRSAAKVRLGQGTHRPVARFRTKVNGEKTNVDDMELWLNDGCLLMKLETKNWHVVDAAGTEDESDIEAWTFVGDSMVAVLPAGKAEVMLVDIDEMALVENLFPPAPLIDIAQLGDKHLVGVDTDGNPWKASIPK